MLSTQELLATLKRENPGSSITEDRIRHILRRGDIARPRVFAGRLLWTADDIQRLVDLLGLALRDLPCAEPKSAQ